MALYGSKELGCKEAEPYKTLLERKLSVALCTRVILLLFSTRVL